jgi:agmatine/peptidylarginine deiminase
MLRGPNNKDITWTYINSLIINNGYKKAVLVPQYNIPEDAEAISIYAQAMPDYNIVGIDSSTIIKSFGAIHCTSLTVPIYIS